MQNFILHESHKISDEKARRSIQKDQVRFVEGNVSPEKLFYNELLAVLRAHRFKTLE